MSWIEDARDAHIAVTFTGDDYETCLVCSQPAPCIAIRLADELEAANTTIECVRAVAEKYDDQCGPCGSISGGRSIAEDIRRALKGEP